MVESMRCIRTFLCIVCFVAGLAVSALAAGHEEDGTSEVLNLATTKQHAASEMKAQPKGYLGFLDPSSWRVNTDRPREEAKSRTVSLYPKGFSPTKPSTQPMMSVASYFFPLSTREDADRYVGLASIEQEGKMELKRAYEKDYNAEILLGYSWGNFGSILFGRALQYERPQDSLGRLSDRGWRIKFVKIF